MRVADVTEDTGHKMSEWKKHCNYLMSSIFECDLS